MMKSIRYAVWLLAVMVSSALALPVTIDFSGLPGPDGIPGTSDDIPYGPNDFADSSTNPRIIADEYLGVRFCPGVQLDAVGGGWNPDGTPITSGNNAVVWDVPGMGLPITPLTITFTSPQTAITVDLVANVDVIGNVIPVAMEDSSGRVVGAQKLINSSAVLGGTAKSTLEGRFKLTSAIPFTTVWFGLSEPANGGFVVDNVSFDSDQQASPSQCTSPPSCPSVPAMGCQGAASGGATLTVGRPALSTASDKVAWKWLSSGAVAVPDFGDPTTATAYSLCVYDANGLVASAPAPAGGTCAGGKPCWSTGSTGANYSQKTAIGSVKMSLTAGGPGHGKIGVKAKGFPLAVVRPVNGGQPIQGVPFVPPLVAQLVRQDSGGCWEATYTNPPLVNTATKFKAKSD
jgi:hypothetical protein